MRRLLTGLVYVALLGCGSNPTAAPPQGTVYFRMDAVSCVYTVSKSVTFYIAGVEMGTESLASGATSTAYLTKLSANYAKRGNPVVRARIAGYTATGGALWTLPANIEVTADVPVTHLVVC